MVHAVIIGAGPYGLSLAAHFREAGIPFRIFGQPMQSWATQMPEGMKLKSDGFASNLSAGSVPFTLEDFCNLTGREYHATQTPVPIEDFVAYGREFARRLVPTLEPNDVTSVTREGKSFRVAIDNGKTCLARHVVLATGLSLFQYIPENLRHLPTDMVTHSTAHRLFDEFHGRDVTVLGRGASSLNAAALLHEAGARVTLLTRKYKIHVHTLTPGGTRPLLQRLLHPSSPLGTSLRSWLSSNFPGGFHALPAPLRRLITYKHLGPAGGTPLQGRVHGKLPILTGWNIERAELSESPSAGAPNSGDRRIVLTLGNSELETREHITSHIIAGTGFRVELARLRFLAPELASRIRVLKNGAPALGRHFQSSVDGLYFIGPAAASSFGPLLRFAAGSQYASMRLTAHLERDYARQHRSLRHAIQLPVPARSSGQRVL